MRRVYIGKFSHHVRERDVERFFRSEGKIREILMKDGFAFVEFEHTGDAEAAVRRLDGRDLNGDRVHVEFAKGPPRGRDGNRTRGGMDGGRGSSRNGPPRRDIRSDRGGRDRDDDRGHGRGSSSGGGISFAEKYGPPRNTEHRIIVENLSSRVSWQDLKDLMRQAGEVTFADAHKRERNMGIVDFASVKDMKHAIDTLNDTEFHGRRIKVYEDKGRRSDRSGGSRRDGGGRRSRGHSRSRSRSPRRYSNSRSRSRSRSRDRPALSRSRSRSPPLKRDRDQPSRSRSISISPSARRKPQRSRSRSRSKDSPRSEVKRQSRSRSVSRSRSSSRSRSASRADSPQRRKSRSRSRSTSRAGSDGSDAINNNNNDSNKIEGGDFKRQAESRSRSKSRSVSRSPSPSSKKARLSTSPASQASVHAED